MFALQFFSDEDAYEYVLHLLLPNALEELTALTRLSLEGHNLPYRRGTPASAEAPGS